MNVAVNVDRFAPSRSCLSCPFLQPGASPPGKDPAVLMLSCLEQGREDHSGRRNLARAAWLSRKAIQNSSVSYLVGVRYKARKHANLSGSRIDAPTWALNENAPDERIHFHERIRFHADTALSTAGPISWPPTVMSHSQNTNFIIGYCIDQRIRKVLHYVPPSVSSTPWCTKCRMLQKSIDRLFKLSEEGLRKTGASLLAIE